MNDRSFRPEGWMGIGVALGAGIGTAMDNLVVGISMGLCIGVAMMAWQRNQQGDDEAE